MRESTKNIENILNSWISKNKNKVFYDSFGSQFSIVGAEAKEMKNGDYVSLQIKHNDDSIITRPLSAFKSDGEFLTEENITQILNSKSRLEGKSTFDITNQIDSWVSKHPLKFFTDKSGVDWTILDTTPPDKITLMSRSGIKLQKKVSSMKINGEDITTSNVYTLLSNNATFDTQIFYGNIIDAINNWVSQNKDKEFSNGSGYFKILKAESKNNITMLVLENEDGIRKNFSLTRFFLNGNRMNIGNTLEMLNSTTSFDNIVRFGDEIEKANEWLKDGRAFLDRNGMPFKILKVERDQNSQVLFVIQNSIGKIVKRNAYAFSYNNGETTIRDGNIVAFLQNANKFDNSIQFSDISHGPRIQHQKNIAFTLPSFESIDIDNQLRLPNGQCARVIDIRNKDTSYGKQKYIDLVVEDGTIIRNISKFRYNSGLIGINTNRPVLDFLKLTNDTCITNNNAKIIQGELRRIAGNKESLGNRSDIEFRYLFYMHKLGFRKTDKDFFLKYFGLQDRRVPDSFLLTKGKMVVFEFDGCGGHGGVYHDIQEDIEKDNQKNELYQSIISKARNGEYLPQISDVCVVRVRGSDVPELHPKGIIEISYDKTSNEAKEIPNVLKQMADAIEKQTGLNVPRVLQYVYPNGIDINNDLQEANKFISEMTGKLIADKSKDSRIGQLSQTIGYGDKFNRCGQFMMITDVVDGDKNNPKPTDKVHVIMEDGRKMTTSYDRFLSGSIDNRRFNKIIDYETKTPSKMTSSQFDKQKDYRYSMTYYPHEKKPSLVIANDAKMNLEEILAIRDKFPLATKEKETLRQTKSSIYFDEAR